MGLEFFSNELELFPINSTSFFNQFRIMMQRRTNIFSEFMRETQKKVSLFRAVLVALIYSTGGF